MRRRHTISRKPTKTRDGSTTKAKRDNAPRAARAASPTLANLQEQVSALTRELAEALEQQTATSEVLGVISSSPGELVPVFDTILANAARLCDAQFCTLYLREGEDCRIVGLHNPPSAFAGEPNPETALGRAIRTKRAVQIVDIQAEPAYRNDPRAVANITLAGYRTVLCVPMLKEKEVIGAIVILRKEVRPFADKQVALLANFARQAVIAIENARLLNELRQRTSDLSESLQQQTATADILRVIAGTPEDSKRALDTIAETAVRMFDAANVNFRCIEGDVLRNVGRAGPAAARVREALPDLPLEPTDPAVRSIFDNRQIPIEDRRVALADECGEIARVVRNLPVRSQAFTPLSRQGKAIGVMIVTRSEVRPFQQGELDLMTSFADQAVIAIENARLFDEIQDKSRQLAEASQHKSQFLANMSHELRTPLNAIIGVSEMLREDAEALKQDTEPLDRVLGAGRHLLALINDILDLSKIEAGRMELALSSFPLAPLIADVVKTIEPLAAKNGNQVALQCDGEIRTMHADQMRLRQALLNLMSNANKFTERGSISIDARQGQENGRDWITLAVTDTGIGMTAEQLGKLFREFSQASTTTASKYGGTGLGLVISKRFCQMMGGDIRVESEPGRGSTFTIRVPRIVEVGKATQ